MEQEREPPRTGSTTTPFTTTWATRTQIPSRSGHLWADLRTFLSLADAALVAHLPKLVRAFFLSFLLLLAHRAAAALERVAEDLYKIHSFGTTWRRWLLALAMKPKWIL
jgi:hypothetical protein